MSAESTIPTNTNKRPKWVMPPSWLILFGILLTTLIVFFPTLSNDFVNWDDDVNILDNPFVQELNWASIKGIFTTPVLGNYNPLPILTFAIEQYYFGLDPFVFHLNNLLLHLFAVGLVFVFGKKIAVYYNGVNANSFAAVVAIIFAIHPMHVESVAWITERKDLLFTIFYLAGMIAYINHAKSQRKGFSALVIIFFLLSCFSKIQAVAFPLAIIGIDFLMGKTPIKIGIQNQKFGKLWRNAGRTHLLLFVISAAVGVMGIYLLQSAGSINANDFSFVDRIFIGAYSFLIYLIKFFIPFELSPVYPYPATLSLFHYLAIIPFAAYLYALVWSYRKAKRPLFFSLWFFLVNIIFVLQFLGAGQAFLADRFTYLPYIGWSLGIAFALHHIHSTFPNFKTMVIGIPILVIACWSWQSFQQTQVWENGYSLWSQVITLHPESDLAFHNRGYWLAQNGATQKAIQDYDQAIGLNPQQGKYFNSRGKLYLQQNKLGEALNDYSQAIQLSPMAASFYNNRSVVYGAQGQFSSALKDLDQALQLQPDFADAYLNRALVHAHRRQYGLALADNLKYLQQFPNDGPIWTEAGTTARFSGDAQAAKIYLNRALVINPGDQVAMEELQILKQLSAK